MKSDRRVPVAIVGAGFSGTMVAAQLARLGVRSVLIDGSGREGRGVAYSTGEAAHLLNVRAEGMSAWPDDPGHFSRAFAAEGGAPRDFAERRFFGRYLRDILDEAVGAGIVELVRDQAVSAANSAGVWTVGFQDRKPIEAEALVLANGNQPPEPFSFAAGDSFINNPWMPEAALAVESAATGDLDVLILGTGLTMVDMVLSLDAAGHRGTITALSRRGLIPRAHAHFTPAPVEAKELPERGLLALWRWVRHRAGETGWRAAVDSLRPHSQALWQSLDERQQRRFLRHARPWWDVHRHRIAPQVAGRLAEMVGEGRLQVMAGRVEAVEAVPDGASVTLRRRGSVKPSTRTFGYVFNCTGPLGAIARTRDLLLRQLLQEGAVRSDHLGMGLEVTESSRAAGAEKLWALGPLTKGRYWEIVAVPDIRGQAAAVAEDIARELEQ